MGMIIGNMIGGCPSSPKTCTFLTNGGQELNAVLVESTTIFTAGINDVRKGKIFANDNGVAVGTKDMIDHEYVYAYIDPNTLICLGIFAGTTSLNDSNFVEISSCNEEYTGKYYINGQWYEDAAGTNSWTPH